MFDSKTTIQIIKYGLVGAMNTCLTLGVIALCKSILGISPMLSNTIGYIIGLINSFLWNKKWVFNSSKGYTREAIKFSIGFGICFGIQFIVVYILSYHTILSEKLWVVGPVTISGYGLATLIGMVLYTTANYIYNRLFAFRQ